MAFVGSIINEKYEILKVIGRGGMSEVFLTMDISDNSLWAIKEIVKKEGDYQNELAVQSLLAEASIMKDLNHPLLPKIRDIISTSYAIDVVMEYIDGESLDKIVRIRGPQPQEKVINWGIQICDALRYMHTKQPPIIYRDMKPANVMLKPDGQLKVIDFGIAKIFNEDDIEDDRNLGTKGYAAPEQFGGLTDKRTDIYCLGVTLYHLVTGKNPCDPPYELFPIRRLKPSLSIGFEEVIDKCIKADPNERYQSCDELMYALKFYYLRDEEENQVKTKDYKTIKILSGILVIIGLIIFFATYF